MLVHTFWMAWGKPQAITFGMALETSNKGIAENAIIPNTCYWGLRLTLCYFYRTPPQEHSFTDLFTETIVVPFNVIEIPR